MSLAIAGRTELIEGFIYNKSPRNDPHRYAVNVLNRLLQTGLGAAYTVQVQDAVFVDGWDGKNAPEPDIAVIGSSAGSIGHPAPKNTRLGIEVTDSTYEHDRTKIALFVRAGIPAYIVNVGTRQGERYHSAADLAKPNGIPHAVGHHFDVLPITVDVGALYQSE